MKSLYQILTSVVSLYPAARNATAHGTTIDLANYGSNRISFTCGALTDGTHLPVIEESYTNNGSDWAAPAAQDVIGPTLVNMTANSGQHVSYIGGARYLRLSFTVAGATTGAITTAGATLGDARKQP